MDTTPRSNRISIAFFGLRNAGKSTLVNAFTNQDIAIVSDTPGTTTDPVSKAMEILPLGPCLITDTAGLDDVGELGEMRVKKTLRVLETADIAVWVAAEQTQSADGEKLYKKFLEECKRRNVVVLEYHRGDSVEELKKKIADVKLVDVVPGLLDGLVQKGDRVVCVCPIDESAPKGRLILPQVQLIRDCLDRHLAATVCQPEELEETIKNLETRLPAASEDSNSNPKILVVTDSQAFASVKATLSSLKSPRAISLTSFSILFARQKGDLKTFVAGVQAVKNLKDGDTVLIAEGCTHHRQCNDIGTVKIPKAVQKLSGKKLNFVFSSGVGFPLESLTQTPTNPSTQTPNLVIHCGGCMLTRREVLRRIGIAKDAGVSIVNYGILLGAACGLTFDESCTV